MFWISKAATFPNSQCSGIIDAVREDRDSRETRAEIGSPNMES